MTPKITKEIEKSKNNLELNSEQKLNVEIKVEVNLGTIQFKERLDNLIQNTTINMNTLKYSIQEMKRLQKDHDFLLKEATKKTKKKKLPRDFTKPRRATGFAQPVLVSDELYTFLIKTKATTKDPKFIPTCQQEDTNWPRIHIIKGMPVSRTDVTSHISKYIKEHNLQNPDERREIVPDLILRKILSDSTEVSKLDLTKKVYTYLQLQRYIMHHFPSKKVKAQL